LSHTGSQQVVSQGVHTGSQQTGSQQRKLTLPHRGAQRSNSPPAFAVSPTTNAVAIKTASVTISRRMDTSS